MASFYPASLADQCVLPQPWLLSTTVPAFGKSELVFTDPAEGHGLSPWRPNAFGELDLCTSPAMGCFSSQTFRLTRSSVFHSLEFRLQLLSSFSGLDVFVS